jgi:hypothetical protein
MTPVESAVLPYSTHTDPLPIVMESGCVPPTGPPVAKTDETAVGSACADATAARKRAVVDRALMRNVMIPLHVMDGK